jgi:LacI family transcriptional regulator
MKRSRLEDVAKKARVTKSIASRILNGVESLVVNPKTRARVIEAAAALNYKPNATARALAAAETKTIACILPPLTNSVYARIVQGAYRKALALGYVVLMAEDSGGPEMERSLSRLIDHSRVDAVIMASAHPGHLLLPALASAKVPHVFVNREVDGSGCNVTMDDALASEVALAYLAGKGHRYIVHLAGPMMIDTNRRRSLGFRRAARRLGLEPLEVECRDLSEAAGFDGAGVMIQRHSGVSAVYISSLRRAIGALHHFQVHGIPVPERMSLVTNDDMPIAEYMSPPLTTLQMPIERLGEMAVEEVVRQIRGGAPRDVMIPTVPEIMERASVRSLSDN